MSEVILSDMLILGIYVVDRTLYSEHLGRNNLKTLSFNTTFGAQWSLCTYTCAYTCFNDPLKNFTA